MRNDAGKKNRKRKNADTKNSKLHFKLSRQIDRSCKPISMNNYRW